jgi:hypothetical protein
MIPSKEQLRKLLDLYNLKNYDEASTLGNLITNEFPNHKFGWKVLGAGERILALNFNLDKV